jgi:hypothetical protein
MRSEYRDNEVDPFAECGRGAIEGLINDPEAD